MSADPQHLRIVHCFRSPVGGIFRHVRDLVSAQVAAGHKVGIVCDSSTGGAFEDDMFAELAKSLELGLARVPMQRHIGIGDLISAYRSYAAIRKMQPDVLHGHGAKGGVYARAFGSVLRVFRSRVARLYSAHGGSLHYDEDTAVGKIFFTVERLLARMTDHLLFVSDYERQTFIRKVGKPPCPSSLVYNGIQKREFEPVPANKDASDFLYIGMMRDLKGPDIFLDALAAVSRKTGRPVTATMIGDGDDRPKYVEQAKRLGLDNAITWLPPMPARQAFALARTVVVPSRAEAMPYIVLETLAAGKPMIASRVGGIPEIFGEKSPALIDPDPGQLADKMAQVLDDETAYARAMPAKADLKRRFSASVMAASIEDIYRKSLTAPGAEHSPHLNTVA